MARVRKLSKKAKKQRAKSSKRLPLSIMLYWRALTHIYSHKVTFLAVLLGYVSLSYILVSGVGIDLSALESDTALGKASESLSTLFTSRTSANSANTVYEGLLFIVFSLIIIRLLRKTFDVSASDISIKNLYYASTTQFVPYILVLLVCLLQLLPGVIGLSFFAEASTADVVIGLGEWIGWMIFSSGALILSLYLISSSIFASYIATLPGVQPLEALRSARSLVKHRRALILPKLIFLPFMSIVLLAVVFLPLVSVLPALASGLYLVLTLSLIMVAHAYLYILYRELL